MHKQISLKINNYIFMQIHPTVTELFSQAGQTDGHDKANSYFLELHCEY